MMLLEWFLHSVVDHDFAACTGVEYELIDSTTAATSMALIDIISKIWKRW